MQNVVIIPIYKSLLLKEEEASLKQCLEVLASHPIKFICPDDLDVSFYINIVSKYDVNIDFVRFDSKFFKSVEAYNDLMLDINFYKTFDNYKYMLIYQLDAWVFRDELDNWCSQGYDYIGAPWFKNFHNANESDEIYEIAGNGGFSLRCIPSFIEVLSVIKQKKYKNKRIKSLKQINSELSNLKLSEKYLLFRKFFSKKNTLSFYLNNYNEDLVIVNCFKKVKPKFCLADYNIGLKFAFEALPAKLYKLNNNNLPFGCHAFLKYDFDFWKEFIKI